MAKYSIAFISPVGNKLIHKVVDKDDKDTALRAFFSEYATSIYSNDDMGYHYFKEDFFDENSGSILACE